jgi:glycosyltransferase involved in cell wall biosynthesis
MGNSRNSSEKEEPDSNTLFEQEIKKPYYGINYLDNFKLPYEKLDVSVVIPTYNRCPYKPGSLKEEQNPLLWAVKSCLFQKPKIKEIIILDENSKDYTPEICEKWKMIASQEYDIPLIYIRESKRMGPGIARNLGVKNSNAKYLFFLDDDAFITPYAIFGAFFSFEKLKEKGLKVGIINLPTYQRASIPSKTVPKKEIGELDFSKGIFKTNKEAFPEEYLYADPEEKYLDSELHLLNPFPILNLNTTAILVSKSSFEEVGGFREHFLNRGEDREFGCRIVENGYLIYFQPDIKFHCVHGSYGLHTEKKFVGEDWIKSLDKSISLKKAMEICDHPQENSGTRVDSLKYIYQTMLADFFLTYVRNKKGAKFWIKRMYKEFVMEGNRSFFGNMEIELPNEKERKEILKRVISNGLDYIKKEEKENIKSIKDFIRVLEENKNEENMLTFLEKL